MAITLSSSSLTIPSLNIQNSSQLFVHSSSKLSSSLQFPLQLRPVRIGNRRVSSSPPPSRRRILPVVAAKKQTFSSLDDLLAKSDKPVLVDFYATWCGPCQFMVPVLDEVSIALKDKIMVVKIDTEKYTSIADKYNVQGLPTFILFKDGKPLDRFEGALPANQLIQRFEDSLKVKQ